MDGQSQAASTAWLSLDEGDSDPTRFLTYLVTALQTIAPQIGDRVLGLPQSVPLDSLLTTLLNEIAHIPDNFVLVLDDYHVIETNAADKALTFLLEHLPPQMHVVIATREDPQLPLARLRARNQMTELRIADLRFTPDEAAEFLNSVMGLNLSADHITALETRTEGWIAGLQLAALSMQGRTDTASFIPAFAGSHRFVLDYLMEEVLGRQPEQVRRFLLNTSVLNRLNGSLCDAVTGQNDSTALLETLERGNMLIIPLDDQRQWYRYHHLFADVLRARSLQEQPDEIPVLHQRASAWYERHGLRSDAVRHALAAEDFERAAGLIELAWPSMRKSRQEATVLTWVKALPDNVIHVRPVLSVACALALLDGGELDAAESRLREAEGWLDAPSDSPMIVVDDVQFQSLRTSIANARAYRAQALGDVLGTVKYTRQALELLPEHDHYERGTSAALLGLAYWTNGELEAAFQSFANGLESLGKAGSTHVVLGGTFILANIRVAQGRLNEAVSLYDEKLRYALAQGEPVLQGTAELYLGLAEMSHERGDLDAARAYLQTGKALGESASLPGNEYLWCAIESRIKQAEGDFDVALDLLREAERFYYRSPIPDVRPMTAMKVRVWVAAGRLTEAVNWVRERNLSYDDDLSYLREYEHMTLARVLIAQYRHSRTQRFVDEALGLLQHLLHAAEAGERMGSALEILVLLALTHEAQGDISAALVPLERALLIAEPEGYVRLFIDEGAPMMTLLEEAETLTSAPDYVHRLLTLFGKTEHIIPTQQGLAEPLTERELEVLRLLRTELTGPEIARQIMVSLNTLRTHTKNIYDKLGVGSRRAALRRAEELDLL